MPADESSRGPVPPNGPPAVPPSGDSRLRSIAKAVSWRVVGSLDTLILSYLFTGNALVAGSIASAETVTKTVLYYVHERGWGLLRFGRG